MKPKKIVYSNKNNFFKQYSEDSGINKPTTKVRISFNDRKQAQNILGFGASFTDSSAYLINEVLNKNDRDELMKALFDKKSGIGLNILRNPMGSSDYSRTIYSYDDQEEGEEDIELLNFSIQHDLKSIIPLTKMAQKINKELVVFASPWSAPGWMKTSGKMVTGKLRDEFYKVYAEYFVMFINAYHQKGIEIYAITPQNEPLFEPRNYPGMKMLATEQIRFVSHYLKPLFISNNIKTKIFGYDHNWDRVDYPFELLDKASNDFDGIAWHWYGGKPISQARINKYYPEKEVHFTEGSGGSWIPEFDSAFSNLMRMGIEIFRSYSQSLVLWNIALDENNGPTVPGFGESTCRGLVKVDTTSKTYERTIDFYGLAHFSKFIQKGATRIWSSDTTKGISNVMFLNPNGDLVVVLYNDRPIDVLVTLKNQDQQSFELVVKAKTVVSSIIKM